jgi:hypothetical protein
LAKCSAALVELVSAVEQCCQELEDCAAVSAETTLVNERCCLEAVECGAMLGETVLTKDQRCSLLAAQATELKLTVAQVSVLADLVLPECFMMRYHHHATRR